MSHADAPAAPRNTLRLRRVRRIAIVYFVAYAVFVTWPGVVPFRGPGPFILGFPFPMVWVTLWVLGGLVIFLLLERAYRVTDDAHDSHQPRTD